MSKAEATERPDASPHLSAGRRVVSSDELFAGTNRLVIEHRGSHYLLQCTRQGKLILTK